VLFYIPDSEFVAAIEAAVDPSGSRSTLGTPSRAEASDAND
jgi:hypothetical protein